MHTSVESLFEGITIAHKETPLRPASEAPIVLIEPYVQQLVLHQAVHIHRRHCEGG